MFALLLLTVSFTVSFAEIIHVPGTWDTIAGALADAEAGDEIVIACGTYYERSLQMKDGVTIRSSTGDPSCVTIDGEQVSEVFFADNIGDTSVLEGLTISGGYAADGAGIHISDASPTIRDCVFIDNDAGWGGAMAVYYSSFPEITDCCSTAMRVGSMGVPYSASTERNPCSRIAFSNPTTRPAMAEP